MSRPVTHLVWELTRQRARLNLVKDNPNWTLGAWLTLLTSVSDLAALVEEIMAEETT